LVRISRQKKTWARYLLRKAVGEIPAGERQRKWHVTRALDRALDERPVTTALDAGSGDGVYSFWLARRLPHAVIRGLDIDRDRVEGCQFIKNRYGYENVEFDVADITHLAENQAYDVIVCSDVLEHLEDDEGQLRRFWRSLKPGGRLIVHVPTGGGPHPIVKKVRPDPHHVREGYQMGRMPKTSDVHRF